MIPSKPVWRLSVSLVVMELAWLALYPLGIRLSHSAAFTTAMLAKLPFSVDETPIAVAVGDPAYLAPTTALCVVLTVLVVAYLAALSALGRTRATVTLVIATALVFQLTLALLPGLFSQDVFSYIAYGRLAAIYDLNPYVWPPSAVAKDPVIPWVADVWRTYPAPYGPVWLDVQWLLAQLTNGLSIPDQALAYRAFASALLIANLAILWRVAPSRGRIVAVALLAWNPLLLFELAANAHNDVLMLTLTLLALLLATRPRVEPSAAVFALGALVKFLSAPAIAWMLLADFAKHRRLFRPIVAVLVVAAVTAAVALPWLELPDSLDPVLNETAGVGYVNAMPDNVAIALADHLQLPIEPTRAAERTLIVVGFVAYLFWEARQVLRSPDVETITRAMLRTLLVYILVVSTSVQPWYFCLPVALAAALGWYSVLARVTLGYSLLALPVLYAHYYLRAAVPAWVDIVYALGPLAWLAFHLLHRRANSPLPAGVRAPDHAARAGHNPHPRLHRLE